MHSLFDYSSQTPHFCLQFLQGQYPSLGFSPLPRPHGLFEHKGEWCFALAQHSLIEIGLSDT